MKTRISLLALAAVAAIGLSVVSATDADARGFRGGGGFRAAHVAPRVNNFRPAARMNVARMPARAPQMARGNIRQPARIANQGARGGNVRHAALGNRQGLGNNRQAGLGNRQGLGNNRQAALGNRQGLGNNRQAGLGNRQGLGNNRQAGLGNRQGQGNARHAALGNHQGQGNGRQGLGNHQGRGNDRQFANRGQGRGHERGQGGGGGGGGGDDIGSAISSFGSSVTSGDASESVVQSTTVQRATSCLVKQYLSDGSVQFQDVCTGESSQ